jgi:hypothetical protein
MSLAKALDEPPNAIVVPPIVMLEFVKPALGNPVQLVKVPLEGVPSAGVVNVGLDNVKPEIVVVVFPKYSGVLPSVIAVAKLLSSWDKGILLVAEPKVYGTAI